MANHPRKGVVRSREPLKVWWAPTISLERLQVELSVTLISSGAVNLGDQCDKLVMVVDQQFIKLTVHIWITHGECKAEHRAGLSTAA